MAEILSEVRKRVEAALLEDERTAKHSIDVVDDNGVVTLTGMVPTKKVRAAAESIAAKQEGVAKVINQIDVVGELEEKGQEEEAREVPPVPMPRTPQH